MLPKFAIAKNVSLDGYLSQGIVLINAANAGALSHAQEEAGGAGELSLVNGILNLFRSDYKPAPGEFLPIDRQSVVQKMQIREMGRERGARGVPSADASDLDTVEQEITDAIKSRAAEERQRAVE